MVMRVHPKKPELSLAKDQSGQATTEYILMLLVAVMLFFGVSRGLTQMRFMEKMMLPLQRDFAATYRYGHPKAKGFDDGAPEYHPRVVGGTNNFRIFINQGKK